MKHLQLILAFVWSVSIQVMNVVFLMRFNTHRSWFFTSFIFGALSIGAIIGNISVEHRDVNSGNVKVPAVFQVLTLLAGIYVTLF